MELRLWLQWEIGNVTKGEKEYNITDIVAGNDIAFGIVEEYLDTEWGEGDTNVLEFTNKVATKNDYFCNDCGVFTWKKQHEPEWRNQRNGGLSSCTFVVEMIIIFLRIKSNPRVRARRRIKCQWLCIINWVRYKQWIGNYFITKKSKWNQYWQKQCI